MTSMRITCSLAVAVLSAMCFNWAIGHGSAPGADVPPAPGGTAPKDAEATAPEDPGGAGRKLRELVVGLDGFRMPCTDCHVHLGSPPKDPVTRGAGPHKHVVLQHGDNNRCFNCHHPDSDNYGSFVDHDGSTISIDKVERFCAKCHGPHYRDWKKGSHGLQTGYWNAGPGDRQRRKTASCISCHDPHQPYFKPIPTLPGPRSLQGELLPDHECRKRH